MCHVYTNNACVDSAHGDMVVAAGYGRRTQCFHSFDFSTFETDHKQLGGRML